MSRRHRAEKREVIPDPKYGDIVVSKFMNAIMWSQCFAGEHAVKYS